MDIEWDGEKKDGIDFASELYNLSPKTKIIFITGYPQRYSQQVFLKNTNLRGFIAKPINDDILLKNLEKIKNEIIVEENRKLILRFNGIITGVNPEDILYIESRAHTATVHTTDNGHLCYEKLNNLAKRLPQQFVLTHKSFLVNMDKIRRIERGQVLLEKDIDIPISKSRYNDVRDNYFRYIASNI
jgi:DNA-binding LytR/AlgR family response regulator